MLEQSLKTVKTEAEEFRVDEEWQHALVSIRELEDMLGLVTFPKAVRDADQAATSNGEELARATGIRHGSGVANGRRHGVIKTVKI